MTRLGTFAGVITVVTTLVSACGGQQPAPTATPPSASAVSAAEPLTSALARLNQYRAEAGLFPVVADPNLSAAAQMHSRYLVENNIAGGELNFSGGKWSAGFFAPGAHDESPNNPLYNHDAQLAAHDALIITSDGPLSSDGAHSMDVYLTQASTIVRFMHPQAAAAGFGSYCKDGECVATIAPRWGLSKAEFSALYNSDVGLLWNVAEGPVPVTSALLRKPLMFPPPSSSVPLASSDGGGWPDALESCGYSAPTGAPAMLELGQGSGVDELGHGGPAVAPLNISQHSFSEGNQDLQHCLIDTTSFVSADGFAQRSGRHFLGFVGAALIVPRAPLKPGHTYRVTITAESHTYQWSYRVAPPSQVADRVAQADVR